MLRMSTVFLFPAYERKRSTRKKKTGSSMKTGFSSWVGDGIIRNCVAHDGQ
jgi:hypothetical protein